MTYWILVDAAGRVSRATANHEYLSAAAVAVPGTSVESLRGRLPPDFPKWRNATPESLGTVLELLRSPGVRSLTLRLHKATPQWEQFWIAAGRLVRGVATLSGKKASFMKAASIVKYLYFGESTARLVGEIVRHDGLPLIKDALGVGTVQLRVVCDSDLEGRDNVEMFDHLWRHQERSGQDLLRSLGFKVQYSKVELQTEQEEPLLLLADYLAGLVQVAKSGGSVPAPLGLRNEPAVLEAALASIQNHVLVNSRFEESVEGIFGDAYVRRAFNAAPAGIKE